MENLGRFLEEKYKNLKFDESWSKTNPNLFNFVWKTQVSQKQSQSKLERNGLSLDFGGADLNQYDALELKCLLGLSEDFSILENCSIDVNRKHIFFSSSEAPKKTKVTLVAGDESYFWFTGQIYKDSELFLDLDFQGSNFCVYKFDVQEGAKLNLCCMYGFKNGAKRFNFYFNLLGEGAEVLFTLVGVNGGSVTQDIKSVQIHRMGCAKSDTLFKSLTTDNASCSFWGLIEISPGAQKSDAYQLARTMMLSESAKATLVPNLRINANDVRCTHGASYSQISPNDIFYCATRGISNSQAKKLLTFGFLTEASARLQHFQQDFLEALEAKLWTLEF
jgi:Fe-S cluster assembly scaffold protein SufB